MLMLLTKQLGPQTVDILQKSKENSTRSLEFTRIRIRKITFHFFDTKKQASCANIHAVLQYFLLQTFARGLIKLSYSRMFLAATSVFSSKGATRSRACLITERQPYSSKYNVQSHMANPLGLGA